jgi:hypothetical protein
MNAVVIRLHAPAFVLNRMLVLAIGFSTVPALARLTLHFGSAQPDACANTTGD